MILKLIPKWNELDYFTVYFEQLLPYGASFLLLCLMIWYMILVCLQHDVSSQFLSFKLLPSGLFLSVVHPDSCSDINLDRQRCSYRMTP